MEELKQAWQRIKDLLLKELACQNKEIDDLHKLLATEQNKLLKIRAYVKSVKRPMSGKILDIIGGAE